MPVPEPDSELFVVVWNGRMLEGEWPDAITFTHDGAVDLIRRSPGRAESYAIERWTLGTLLASPVYAPYSRQVHAQIARGDRRPIMLRPEEERAHRGL